MGFNTIESSHRLLDHRSTIGGSRMRNPEQVKKISSVMTWLTSPERTLADIDNLVDSFEAMGNALAVEYYVPKSNKGKSTWLTYREQEGLKRNGVLFIFTWEQERVSVPDNHEEMSALEELYKQKIISASKRVIFDAEQRQAARNPNKFNRRLRNKISRGLPFSLATEQDWHDYLYALGFHNGGASITRDIQLHVYHNVHGYQTHAKEKMKDHVTALFKRLHPHLFPQE